MKKQIKLNKKEVEYTLRVSRRARRMRLSIYCNGNFVVTTPQNMSMNTIEQFILKKAKWVVEKLEYFKRISGRVFVNGTKKDYIENKGRALVLAQDRIGHFNQRYGFEFNKITVKNQKTCWGSCSKKGNLNFNYKIALLSERLADYIIVHELCHLKEFNHSKNFWNLVAIEIPDHVEIRKELKTSGIKFV